jgi:hypothetical protein
MSLLPGAPAAFKAKPAAAVGVKPQQVGGVKFPGKIDTSKIGRMLPRLPITKQAAIGNAALGAMFAALFGRVSAAIPGVRDFLAANPHLRDAALGAAVAEALSRHNEPEEGRDVYTQRPDAPANGWKLQ